MGYEGPIPLSEILAYCQMFGIDDPDDRADFLRTIRAMDAVYLEERQKARDRSSEKDEKPAPR
ncbi:MULTISPECIES: hypothetical protein [Aurantimonas]|uniref:phage tail assembly chaperone n=1 Tax=Aurantimonas sp. TaxID=1872654 RepID=UPI0035165C50